jgi:hypothetical protein
MYIEEALLKELAATAAVKAIIGQRIYYITAPQDVTNPVNPYVVVQKISDTPTKHRFDAAAGASAARIQITIIGDTYYDCKRIAAAIKTAINGFKGTMGGVGGLAIGACFIAGENDIPYDTGAKLFGLAVDYMFYY